MDARRNAAMRLIDAARLDSADGRKALAAGLARLGVEAQITADPKFGDPSALKTAESSLPADQKAKQRPVEVDKTPVVTPGLEALLQTPGGKLDINHELRDHHRRAGGCDVSLFVRRESAPLRWAIALGAAAAALAAALVLAVSLLRRWVLRPLAAARRRTRTASPAASSRSSRSPRAPARSRRSATRCTAWPARCARRSAPPRPPSATAASSSPRSRTTCARRCSRCAARWRRSSTGSTTATRSRAPRPRRPTSTAWSATCSRSRAPSTRATARAFEPVDLSAIARRAAETVEPGAIRLDVRTNGPVAVNGDPVALQRVLTNLLDNALRHAHTRVELSVLAGRVEVADDGAGFAAADLPHVFEPLFRGDRARAAGGAGLGLAIARRLVRAHGGEVEATNGPAGGARVHVILPLG